MYYKRVMPLCVKPDGKQEVYKSKRIYMNVLKFNDANIYKI